MQIDELITNSATAWKRACTDNKLQTCLANRMHTGWSELEARVHMARYRVLEDMPSLELAKELAYSVGFATDCNPKIPIQAPGPLLDQEPILMKEWAAGRQYVLATFLEARTWTRPNECGSETGHACDSRPEQSAFEPFLHEALQYVHNFAV